MFTYVAPLPVANIADVSEEMRDQALARAASTLKKIDEVRKKLELPIDQLPVLIDLYGKHVLALQAEAAREEAAKRMLRVPLTLRSAGPIAPEVKQAVTLQPTYAAFRVEDITIQGECEHWLVHDLKVGNRSQFLAKMAPVPGTNFGPNGVLARLRLETCQTAMDFVMEVEYIGPSVIGAVFEASIVGTAFEH